MSARNNKRFLLGFGVVSAVLVVVLTLWRPQVPNEPASGAIGAVEKHHAPQISKADVVLVDEPTRQQQKLLYGDAFADSIKLQNVAQQLGAVSNAGIGSAADAQQLQSAQAQLQAMEADVQSRFQGSMSAALASVQQLSAKQELASNQLGHVSEEAAQLSATLASNHQLSSEEMAQMAARLMSISQNLQSRSEAAALEASSHELASAVAAVESKSELASAKLESVATALNAKANLNSISLASYAQSLESMATEAAALGHIQTQLSSKDTGAGQADSAIRELASTAATLESNALQSVEMQMESRSQMASMLHEMEMQLASAQQAGSAAQLGSIQQALAARQTEFGSHAAAEVGAALSSFSNYMASRAEMASRINSRGQLEASMVGSNSLNARIDARTELAQRMASTATLQSNLASIERHLESNSALGSMLSSAPQLAAQARALESRANALQAKAN